MKLVLLDDGINVLETTMPRQQYKWILDTHLVYRNKKLEYYINVNFLSNSK